jgi:hypothetical protein
VKTKLYGTHSVGSIFGVQSGTVNRWVKKGYLNPDFIGDQGEALFLAATLWHLRTSGVVLRRRNAVPHYRRMEKELFDRHFPEQTRTSG